MTSEKVIHTGLYGERAFKILDAVKNAYASGSWYTNSYAQFKSSIVSRAPDNEIVFLRNRNIYNELAYSIWRKSNNEALKWIGLALKSYVRDHNHEILWKRTSDDRAKIAFYELDAKGNKPRNAEQQSLIVSVDEVYYIYDKLLQRQKLDRKYDKKLIDELTGTPNDPISTEIEIARREELKKCDEQLHLDLNEIEVKYQKEHRDITEKYYAEERALNGKKYEEIQKLEAEYAVKKEALVHQYAQMTSMVA